MPKAKTRNSVKKSSKSKTRNNKSKLNNPKPAFQVYNVGSTETIVSDNNKSSKSSINWKGDYDGELANIHVSVNTNGRNENMDIKLNNEDLMHLLGQPVVQEPIEERLMNDFLRNRRPTMSMPMSMSMPMHRPIMYMNKQGQEPEMPLIVTNEEYEPVIVKKIIPKNNKSKKTK